MFEQYLERWNKEEPLDAGDIQKRGTKTKHDFKLYGQMFEIQAQAKKADVRVDLEDEAVSFSLPVKVESDSIVDGKPYYAFTDTLQVRLSIAEYAFQDEERAFAAGLGRELPERQFKLTVHHDMSRGVCAGVAGICAAMQRVLIPELQRKVLDLEDAYFGTFFDAPSAARQIKGLVVAANRMAFATTSSRYQITDNNIYVMINCDASEAERALASPVPRDTYQLSLSQNLFDFTMIEALSVNQ